MSSAVSVAGMTMIISHAAILIAGLAVGVIVALVDSRIERPDH